MNPDESDKLEAPIHRMLRNLPDRKAPAGLEARVLAELLRRASLPWWRKSFSHWPAAVRAAFFAVSAIAAAVVVYGLVIVSRSSGAHQISGDFSSSYSWLVIARDIAGALGTKARMLLAPVPSFLLYGGAGIIALCYAAVAAAGAATYRALSPGRQTA
jgi:hypothetical protein